MDLGHLSQSPADSSASAFAVRGSPAINAFDFGTLQVGAYGDGVETYRSADIDRAELRISFGENGYLLYNDSNGYYWCGGEASYTDSGSKQVNTPTDAPDDCKGHAGLGSGWDFSGSDTHNRAFTMCGADVDHRWMSADMSSGRADYGTVGAALAIWVR